MTIRSSVTTKLYEALLSERMASQYEIWLWDVSMHCISLDTFLYVDQTPLWYHKAKYLAYLVGQNLANWEKKAGKKIKIFQYFLSVV